MLGMAIFLKANNVFIHEYVLMGEVGAWCPRTFSLAPKRWSRLKV